VKRKAPATEITYLSTPIHPEIRRDLRIAAMNEGVKMPEKLHVILCHELGREDLILEVPDYASAGS
jgi:hypothetical protein